MVKLDGAASEEIEHALTESTEQLTARGICQCGSSRLQWPEGAIAIHTSFGPAEQDKETNQDFVVAWVPEQQRPPSGIRWALAMADGVTASYYAELGAELACRVSLARLVAHEGAPQDKARDAVNAAGDAIGAVVDVIEEDAEHYRPEELFVSTWRYTLREGLLLQTTLSLAWLEDGVCHLAFIGDGGAAIQFRKGRRHQRIVLAGPNVETSRVHAIGPRNRRVDDLDSWQSVGATDISMLAIYTDGVGLGIGPNASLLFEELQSRGDSLESTNVAKHLIQEWIRTKAEDFEDNLTLAIVTCD
jgi:hypothetical protein